MKLLFTILMIAGLAGAVHQLNAQTIGQKDANNLIKKADQLFDQKQFKAAQDLYKQARRVWKNCDVCEQKINVCEQKIKDSVRPVERPVENSTKVEDLKRAMLNGKQAMEENKKMVQELKKRYSVAEGTSDSLKRIIDQTKMDKEEREAYVKKISDSLEQISDNSKSVYKEKKRLKEHLDSIMQEGKDKDLKITHLIEQQSQLSQEKDRIAAEQKEREKDLAQYKSINDSLMHVLSKIVKDTSYGKFNYFSFRLVYPFTGSNFNNPVAGSYSNVFALHKELKPQFRAGIELGGATHILRLGTPMLRLGFNFNFAAQAFGKGSAVDSGANNYASVKSHELFMATLGLGPQVTFKPFEFMRVALYARFGMSALYTDYRNTEYIKDDNGWWQKNHDLNIQMRNLRFTKDIGIDITLKKFSVGMVWSFMEVYPNRDQYYTPNVINVNKLVNYASSVPYDQPVNYDRFSILVGLAL